jgi:hypothetical protein
MPVYTCINSTHSFWRKRKNFLLHKAIIIEQLLREELGKGIGQNPASSLAEEGFL